MYCRDALILFAVSAGLVLASPWAAGQEYDDEEFHVKDGVLHQEDDPVRLKGIQTPELAHPNSGFAEYTTALNQISKVGANTVVFNLYGFNEDGTDLSHEGRRGVLQLYSQIDWRRIGAVCRVLAGDAPRSDQGRLEAVRTAARTFERNQQIIFWIDGTNAGALAQEFKSIAPNIVVAAPEGGDVDLVTAAPKGERDKPVLLVTEPMLPLPRDTHFVFPGTEESYATFDQGSALPIESEPWTPDNSVLAEEEREDGWIALFDGKSFDGWTVTGHPSGWEIKNGEIHWVNSRGNDIQSRDRYGDFIFRIDWKIEEGGNSGIFLHAPRANRESKVGIEMQLRGNSEEKPHKNSAGAIYDVVAPRVNATKPPGEWNELEVRWEWPHFKATLNGQVIHDLNFEDNRELRYRLKEGFIGLQDHSDYVAFRNIRIKKL